MLEYEVRGATKLDSNKRPSQADLHGRSYCKIVSFLHNIGPGQKQWEVEQDRTISESVRVDK